MNIEIGKRIKYRREELGMTQEELAELTGYKSRSSINKIEMDGRGLPQKKIVSFADALKTTPAALMGWEKQEQTANAMTIVTHNALMRDIVLEGKNFNEEALNRLLSYARFLKQDTSKQGEE